MKIVNENDFIQLNGENYNSKNKNTTAIVVIYPINGANFLESVRLLSWP